MSGLAQVVSTFDTAVAAFEIRFERQLDSSWRDLAGKTREAIVGEGLELRPQHSKPGGLYGRRSESFLDEYRTARPVGLCEYVQSLLSGRVAGDPQVERELRRSLRLLRPAPRLPKRISPLSSRQREGWFSREPVFLLCTRRIGRTSLHVWGLPTAQEKKAVW